jgi:hypothetical protein
MTHDPLEELYLDLRLDAIEEAARADRVEPGAVAAAMQKARALLTSAGPAREPVERATRPHRFEARLAPIATLAAADLVKATVRFEVGVLRLLQSTLRPDLAAELVLDENLAAEFAGSLFLVRLSSVVDAIALLPGESPVFTGVNAESFAEPSTIELNAVALDELDDAGMAALRRSRRSLRDPGSLAAYDEAIARAER